MTIRVLIADDHPIYRGGLVGVLEEAEDVDVVGQAADGSEAVGLSRQLAPDVVMMDLHMPGMGGIEATRRLAEEAPSVRVLVLTMLDDDESVLAAMRAGAHGYLVKGTDGERILAAVRAVADGQAVFGSDVAARVLGVLAATGRGRREGQPFPTLTDREVEVLELIAEGHANAAIARQLFVSDKTVRNHISSIFTKLGVANRSQAIVVARDAGLGTGR